jgi:hypothetical protein
LTLVDTLAPKRRASSGTAVKAEAAGSTGVKVEDDVQKDDASEMKPPQKYALHMLLPGGDYFTSATEADPQEIESGALRSGTPSLRNARSHMCIRRRCRSGCRQAGAARRTCAYTRLARFPCGRVARRIAASDDRARQAR